VFTDLGKTSKIRKHELQSILPSDTQRTMADRVKLCYGSLTPPQNGLKRFEAFMAVKTEVEAIWVVTPCSVVVG
jgi:hypothetical protein